jgi:major membrane immunogen (membrane-anchored lipoprotein)
MLHLDRIAARNRLVCGWNAILALPALLLFASCGEDDGLGKRYPVSGTVTYNGNPLERGEISFVSDDLKNHLGASGQISNGSYSLSTGGNDDGAQVGKYKVTITAKEDFVAKAKADFQRETKQTQSNFIPPQFIAKAEAAAKSLIPAGYGDPRTTTLTAEVKAEPNSFNFTLTDKDAPPEPPKGATSGKGAGRHRN